VKHPLHPFTWLTWLAAAMVALTVTRNPLYLAITLLCIGLVYALIAPADEEQRRPLISPWRFGLVVVPVSALFNALMVHVGAHVLFTLPAWLPLLGGPITLEALLYGALNGLALTGLFVAFGVINRAISVQALLRLVPRAYYPVAVITSIAVTFVPTALQQMQQIREAQMVRGNRMHSVRAWLPLVTPLLEASLERSMQLAESMMARGFVSGSSGAPVYPRLLLLSGMVVVVAGWLLQLVWAQVWAGSAVLLAGAGLLVGGVWLAGRQHPHTVYRQDVWHLSDAGVIVAAVAVMLVYLAPLPGLERMTLFFYPYPALAWPAFSPAVAAGTLGLLAPLVVQ
jgi:energy-coupling factor transport system permease protein